VSAFFHCTWRHLGNTTVNKPRHLANMFVVSLVERTRDTANYNYVSFRTVRSLINIPTLHPFVHLDISLFGRRPSVELFKLRNSHLNDLFNDAVSKRATPMKGQPVYSPAV